MRPTYGSPGRAASVITLELIAGMGINGHAAREALFTACGPKATIEGLDTTPPARVYYLWRLLQDLRP